MNLRTIQKNNITIALVYSDTPLITDVQTALDLIATVSYETGSSNIALHQSAISEDFFHLRTGLAGDVLQKFINYKVKSAIIGNFLSFSSQALKDFIYECNHGKDLFFVSTEEEAIQVLAGL